MTKQKSISQIIIDTISHGEKLYNKGAMDFVPTRVDVMVAMIIESSKGRLASRNKEVSDFVLQYEEICKYAKPVPDEIVKFIKREFSR